MKTLSDTHIEAHIETRPIAFPLERREFHFVTDQLRNADNIVLTVTAGNRTEAKRLLREFLEDVERRGLQIS